MRKLLPFLVGGLAALSFSAIAADNTTDVDANTKIQSGDTKAGAGADVKADQKKHKGMKEQKDRSGAGSTSNKVEESTLPSQAPASTPAAPAPAPAPAPEKKTN